MAKSKTARYTIEVEKKINLGSMPMFIQFGHRSLEKGNPPPTSLNGKTSSFIVAKDVMRLSVSNQTLLDNIESIEFTYEGS